MQPYTRKCTMRKGWTVWLKIGGGILLGLGGVALLASLTTSTTYADPPPPFVTTSSGATVTVIPTPTLPARLTLLAPAFALFSRSGDLVIAYDWLPADVSPLLAYRPDAASPWQKIHAPIDEAARQIVVPAARSGEYALVKVAAPAALPGNAIVVDDQSTRFARYGPSGNWRDATYQPDDYYLGHAYWTSNTYNTAENWGVWTPATLDGLKCWYLSRPTMRTRPMRRTGCSMASRGIGDQSTSPSIGRSG